MKNVFRTVFAMAESAAGTIGTRTLPESSFYQVLTRVCVYAMYAFAPQLIHRMKLVISGVDLEDRDEQSSHMGVSMFRERL
jgi:hypothetical protein